MQKKKGDANNARQDSPVKELDEKETLMHYNAVLIEELNSKMQLVLELVKASHEETGRRFASMEEKFERRFATLELALRSFKDETDKRFSAQELGFRGLKDDMADMERRICSKINRIAERCDNHECRLGALEANQ